jgi:hypothetical protein
MFLRRLIGDSRSKIDDNRSIIDDSKSVTDESKLHSELWSHSLMTLEASFIIEKFGKNKTLINQIFIIYRLMSNQIFLVINE